MDTPAHGKPLPRLDDLNAPFWEHARRGVLAIQRCQDCGHRQFPAAPCCPACLGARIAWEPVSGRAELLSWAEFHHAYWDGVKGELPYRVCLVRLAEGPMMISTLAGGGEPAVGSALAVQFRKITDTVTLPEFAAEGGGAAG